MKIFIVFIAGLLLSNSMFSQRTEFDVHPNGLIYSEKTMHKLASIVDSLNLAFMTCDLDKIYYATPQTIGHLVELDTLNVKEAKTDMEQNMPLEAFLKKYALATIDRDVIIVKHKDRDYENKEIVTIAHLDIAYGYGFQIESDDVSLYKKDLKNQWLLKYHKKSNYSEESIRAFYFPNAFESRRIPEKYARMIGYSDCLVDTTTAKFKEDAGHEWTKMPAGWMKFTDKEKKELLDQMRSTRVMGSCSMDSRPRQHAMYIALLSAETTTWKVFLRSHLDIMNDRFERVSDGSYAWAGRNTYIRELEELKIDVPDLLLGITFRIANPAQNHYYSSIERLGRALAETQHRTEIEKAMLGIIQDPELDYFNRILFYFLFLNYNHYTEDESIKEQNMERLASTLSSFPGFIRERLEGD